MNETPKIDEKSLYLSSLKSQAEFLKNQMKTLGRRQMIKARKVLNKIMREIGA